MGPGVGLRLELGLRGRRLRQRVDRALQGLASLLVRAARHECVEPRAPHLVRVRGRVRVGVGVRGRVWVRGRGS